MTSDTLHVSITYFFKGIERIANISIVTNVGQPAHYWFKFKVRPGYFIKQGEVWEFKGDPINDDLKQSLINGLENYLK